MTALSNTRIVLASRPSGWVTPENFRLEEAPVEEPREGELLVRVRYLSLDPYMRGRMDDRRSYAPPQPLNEVMLGGGVGEVLRSASPGFSAGDLVLGMFGWQRFARVEGKGVRKLEPGLAPPQAFLGPLGMPGVTAHLGLVRFGEPKEGDTVVVSSAAGAVGSVVGQLAKRRGCRVVGIAGGPERCEHVVKDLGFDACVDHRAEGVHKDLAAATPKGIDVLFENVGGPVMDTCLARLNAFARVALCGLVSQYNDREPYGVRAFASLLVNRVRLQGFIVSEHPDAWPPALAELVPLVRAGKLVYRETVAQGLERAPEAFVAMLEGKKLGKQLVAVDP